MSTKFHRLDMILGMSFSRYATIFSITALSDISQNADLEKLLPLFSPNSVPDLPHSINVGEFHATNADPRRLKTANKDEIYVTIAVTDLGPDNGWFTFYEGSHRRQPPFTTKVALNLRAGDAVAWSGRILYIHSSGGGGKFVTLVYRLIP